MRQIKLTLERPGHYYLSFPYEKTKKSQEEKPVKKVIALDPGVRTFQTGYNTEGNFYEFGRGGVARISRLSRKLDQLISKTAETKGRKKHKNQRCMQKAIDRKFIRIKNLITDCHLKLVKHLTNQFDAVLIPSFDVAGMVQKDNCCVCQKVVQSMLGWSHYRFCQQLLWKAEENPNCKIHVVTEEFTSKCCGNCSKLHHTLGGNKTFKCPSCQWTLDCDMNGARNIMLMNLEHCGYKIKAPMEGLVTTP